MRYKRTGSATQIHFIFFCEILDDFTSLNLKQLFKSNHLRRLEEKSGETTLEHLEHDKGLLLDTGYL